MTIKRADERLAGLARPDKWYLGGGDGILWAPPFPLWLDRPGFWDEAHVYSHPIAPLFSLAVVDAAGREIPLRPAPRPREWRPDRIVQEWLAVPPRGKPSTLRETRSVLPGGRFLSRWRVPRGFGPAWLVAFSRQPGDHTEDVVEREGGVGWRRTLFDRHDQPLGVEATLAFPGQRPAACAAVRSEGAPDQPTWAFTPFPEQWADGVGDSLGVRLAGLDTSGHVYLAVAAALVPGAAIVAQLTLRPVDPAPTGAPPEAHASWRDEFSCHPVFSCSDPFLERYFDYRIYGLHLNRLDGGFGNIRHPTVAEGIGYFHVPIAYSAQCHLYETRWRHTPDLARGILRNFLEGQREDGSFPGRLFPTHLHGTDFYHANWGDAVRAVHAVHPDDAFLAEAADGLADYAEWLLATRDPEESGLFDVVNQLETGQEYMPRYQAVDPDADRHGWTNRIRLKGIDVTVYAYQLFRGLAWMHDRLGRTDEAGSWTERADFTGYALLDLMWDDEADIFTDVDPATMQRTGVKSAVSFYPLLTDLLDDAQVAALLAHLEDERTFGTPFPVPSTSADDPLFDPHARWKGKRHICPWNGRVWPMTNSHVVEGLLRQWQRGRRFVGPRAADLLRRFVRMMFFEGDVHRPNCFEHYNPLTGHPSVYRGIDDYQHSWVNDLLIRGAAGVEPHEAHLLVDPLPVPIDRVSLTDLRIRGRRVWVHREGEEIEVDVDGRPYYGTVGTPVEIPW